MTRPEGTPAPQRSRLDGPPVRANTGEAAGTPGRLSGSAPTRLRFWCLSWLLLLLAPLRLRAADTNAVLDAWLAAQTNFTTWSATFVQTRSLKALTQPLVSTGQVWFARPNRFRWELGRPAQTIAAREGDLLQVIYPRLKRVELYPLAAGKSGVLGEALGLLDAGFPKDRTEFAARFRLLSLGATNGAWLLDLQPVSPAARRVTPSIRVTLDATSYALLANEIAFPDGSRLRNEFSGATQNAALPPDLFRPTLDPSFKVVQPATQ